MKKNLFLLLLFCPLLVLGQSSKATELSVSLNTVEPHHSLGHISLENTFLEGGKYTNNSCAWGLTGKYFFNKKNAFRLKIRHYMTIF
jgi:hypothetical protein